MHSFISRGIAVLLTLALLAGGVAAQSRKKKRAKQSKAATSQPATPKSPEHTHNDGVWRITPAEAHAALAKGTALMVDVRSDASYKSGHIKGAILIPFGEVKARINKLPRNKLIITYCA